MPALHPAPGFPRVAVVTVSYGSAQVLETFLESMPAATRGPVVVIVVDNKPTAAANVEALTRSHDAQYLPLPENRGYGGAINAAVRTLPPSIAWVLVSNPDLVLGAGSIDALVAAGDADSNVASVGPAIVTDGEIYPSARTIPSLRNGVGHALFANMWQGNPWTQAYRQNSHHDQLPRDAGWLSGACVLVRRSLFDQVGGFDEGFFMYFEDVDLGYRFGKLGFRNVYEPAALVEHSGAHSTDTDAESARMIAAHHDSALRFLGKKYSGPWLAPVRVGLRLGLTVRSAVLKRKSGHH